MACKKLLRLPRHNYVYKRNNKLGNLVQTAANKMRARSRTVSKHCKHVHIPVETLSLRVVGTGNNADLKQQNCVFIHAEKNRRKN